MPKLKNYFEQPEFHEATIKSEEDNTIVGHIRITPAGVKWRKTEHDWYSVPLDQFIEWITHPDTKAKRTTK